ncbi:MAG TPA: DegT/DnrJ/EryC1/StrS family aminotransferase [Candidatus Hydrogenedentes bacterium]|nr:DegT/DnrJ/EryC1/StrS family aminotransferase [Candidatus Hydrogenedentota bacterium]
MTWQVPHSAPTTGADELAAVARVLESGHLAQGRETAAFEEACAAIVGRAHGVAVNSGTSALHLALEAVGVAEGDRVLMPSYGCAALSTAVTLSRAIPELADVDDYFNLAPSNSDANFAVVPHLFGAVATLPSNPLVIEDIAQSIGGPSGRKGVAAIASFYATKLVTTGEGGMVLTDDEGLAEAVRDRRDYDNRDDFARRYNYKLTDLQAAVGRAQLSRLAGFIARRRMIAAAYDEAFRAFPMRLPSGREHIYFRYVVMTSERERLESHLQARGIEAKRPVYRPAHHYFGNHYPMAERAHDEAVSIPIFPAMRDEQVDVVIRAVREFWP